MDRTLLDTDTYSEILKGRNDNVNRRAAEYEDRFGQFTISVITMAEIVKGLQKRGELAEVDEFVTACDWEEVLLLDLRAAVIAGRIYGELEKRGLPIGRADPLIAAVALGNDLTLGFFRKFSGYNTDLNDIFCERHLYIFILKGLHTIAQGKEITSLSEYFSPPWVMMEREKSSEVIALCTVGA